MFPCSTPGAAQAVYFVYENDGGGPFPWPFQRAISPSVQTPLCTFSQKSFEVWVIFYPSSLSYWRLDPNHEFGGIKPSRAEAVQPHFKGIEKGDSVLHSRSFDLDC